MSAGWRDVLDQQVDLWRYWRSPHGQGFSVQFAESMRQVSLEEGQPRRFAEASRQLVMAEAEKLFKADPFYVEEDMMDLVEAASEQFTPESLLPSDLLTAYGFVVLPRPMEMIDRNSDPVSFRAIAWSPIEFRDPTGGKMSLHGINLSLYSYLDDLTSERESYIRRMKAEGHEVTHETIAEMKSAMGTPFLLCHVTPWPFGSEVPGGEKGELTRSWWRPIQAFFRLTLQTIGDRYSQKPDRPSQKRYKRAMKAKEDRYITVIRLRRPKHSKDGPPTEVNWTHRWIVGGFWRNQWYPSLNTHRLIYIAPYVKGPEDLPLLVRKGRAFEFVQ